MLELTRRASTQARHSCMNLKLVLVSLVAPPMVITVLLPSAWILTTVVLATASLTGISRFCLNSVLTLAQWS